MKLRLPARRRLLRWIAILIPVVIVLLYLVVPAGFGVAVVFPYKESVGAPPAGFAEVTLTTEDGVRLAAWYAPPANGAAIILIHGGGGSREGVRDHAAMLLRHDYGVLALDLRGHGESGGRTNRLGWQGTRDVRAAAAYLQAQPDVSAIGGLGLSLGGEVLLGAASEVPALAAIVADGATQRSLDELRALPSERPLVHNFTARVMFATVQLLSGDDPPKPLLDSMTEAQSTAFLLIAAGSNALEVDFNTLFAETVGERATLWVAPDASHTGAFKRYPDEYERRVIEFFDAVLR
ncbi:MAG: alpha/beta fold hydrolase [Chloroflexota bacterium]